MYEMPVDCHKSTSGGKGNEGMFFERSPNICVAGIPTAQGDNRVSDALQHYLLKDEVDALMSDAIIPPKIPKPIPPLRHPLPKDMRNAGIFGDVANIVNPPLKSKFQVLVDNIKDTSYSSYWKKQLGSVKDPVPMLPEGLNIYTTTFGKKLPYSERLYDIVMPKIPLEDKKLTIPGEQINRNYCKPAFDPELTYGYRTHVDKRGTYAKCCLTDDRIVVGNGNRVVLNKIQTSFQDFNKARLGKVLAANDNLSNVPPGYAFGILKAPDNIQDCLSFCKMNPEREFLRKCLAHLNTVRKCLSTRFLPRLFHNFYLNLKYFDAEKTGWLPKEIVYNFCASKLIRFDPRQIEPLISKWQSFDGENIDYKFFMHMINYREPIAYLPNVPDFPLGCIDFHTTYSEMVKPGQKQDESRMAGVRSGRYLDLDYPITLDYCSKADRQCLPQESDVMSCVSPSIFTLLHVNHRDMYAKREPDVIKKVFRSAGETFSDEKFQEIWNEAKKYHSEGWVCYETFRRAMREMTNP